MNPMPAAVARAFAVALACAAALVPDEGIAQVSFDCVTPATPSLVAPVVLGNGSAGSVTTAQVQQALDAGGPIRLDVGVSTLVLGTTLRVTRATTLDLGGATLSGGHVRRVIEVQNPANQTYAFTLSHGSIADGSTPTASGAGLYKATGGPWQAVTLRFFDVRFTGNHAIASAQDDGGGALYVVGAAEVAVVRGQFDGNSGSNGGAFYSLGSKRVNLYDSVFTGNHATGSGGNPGNGGNGGAIGVDGDARFLNLCRIRLIDNEANAFGGGLFTVTYSNASHTRLQDSTVQGNTSSAADKLAGGAYIQGSPIAISGSTFRDNDANGYAGLALFGYGGVLEGSISNSTFVGNLARGGLGGAMAIQAASALTLQNLTIAHNAAPCAGCFAAGIANDSGASLTLRNVLFEDNVGGNAVQPMGDVASRRERCRQPAMAADASGVRWTAGGRGRAGCDIRQREPRRSRGERRLDGNDGTAARKCRDRCRLGDRRSCERPARSGTLRRRRYRCLRTAR